MTGRLTIYSLREYASRGGIDAELQALLYGAADTIEQLRFTQSNIAQNMDSLHRQIAVLRESLITGNSPDIPVYSCAKPCWCDRCFAEFDAKRRKND